MVKLIDEARDWLKMLSVQFQLAWGVPCQIFAAMPTEHQAQVLDFFGLDGARLAVPMSYFAQVCAGVAAATIAARLVKQPALHPEDK